MQLTSIRILRDHSLLNGKAQNAVVLGLEVTDVMVSYKKHCYNWERDSTPFTWHVRFVSEYFDLLGHRATTSAAKPVSICML